MWYLGIVEKGIVPEGLIRFKIRNLLKQRIQEEKRDYDLNKLVDELKSSPIALSTEAANEQHYELPATFFENVLGKHLKYSCAFWNEETHELSQAEEKMLQLSAQRAEIKDGMDILELGCGWGSLSLYMAREFPNSKITAISNSNSQREFITAKAVAENLQNLSVITADMNDFQTNEKFDRVISIEMFEHMRNYKELLRRIHGFLKLTGKLFVHIFTHKELTYKFEIKDESDWMSKYFFTDGIMPGENLFNNFQDDMFIEKKWHMSGIHYQKTAEAWLKEMQCNKKKILEIFNKTYGKEQSLRWWVYWRIFFLACSEAWGFRKGKEWTVSHYLFGKQNQN